MRTHRTCAPIRKGFAMGCSTCGGSGFGILSFARAILSGPAAQKDQDARIMICRQCQAKEPNGNTRLYRQMAGQEYCGQPRLKSMYRDEKKYGCGCSLNLKTRFAKSDCPLGYWSNSAVAGNPDGTLIISRASEAGMLVPEAIALRSYMAAHPAEKVTYAVIAPMVPWAIPLHNRLTVMDLEAASKIAFAKGFDLASPSLEATNGYCQSLHDVLGIKMNPGGASDIITETLPTEFDVRGAAIISGIGMALDKSYLKEVERTLIANKKTVFQYDNAERSGCTSPSCAKLNPKQIYRLIGQSSIVVGSTGWLVHFAAAMGVKAVAICPPGNCRAAFDYTSGVSLIELSLQDILKQCTTRDRT